MMSQLLANLMIIQEKTKGNHKENILDQEYKKEKDKVRYKENKKGIHNNNINNIYKQINKNRNKKELNFLINQTINDIMLKLKYKIYYQIE